VTKPQPTQADPLGTVHVTKHVLASIIELTALQVEGVAKFAPVSSPWPRLPMRAEPQRGLALNVRGETVSADLYLILQPGVNMPQVGRAVQDAVAAAIEDMLGMTVGEINIFIQDVA
jgi:uncharacterized alkaline shock family protein YloU